MLNCITKTKIVTDMRSCQTRAFIEVKMKSNAIQLAIFPEFEIDYELLQEKHKHLTAKKRRRGGVL